MPSIGRLLSSERENDCVRAPVGVLLALKFKKKNVKKVDEKTRPTFVNVGPLLKKGE